MGDCAGLLPAPQAQVASGKWSSLAVRNEPGDGQR